MQFFPLNSILSSPRNKKKTLASTKPSRCHFMLKAQINESFENGFGS